MLDFNEKYLRATLRIRWIRFTPSNTTEYCIREREENTVNLFLATFCYVCVCWLCVCDCSCRWESRESAIYRVIGRYYCCEMWVIDLVSSIRLDDDLLAYELTVSDDGVLEIRDFYRWGSTVLLCFMFGSKKKLFFGRNVAYIIKKHSSI